MQQIVVNRADLSAVTVREQPGAELADGQVRLAVHRFGLSANNISYAIAGDFLGYWAHFPVDESWGCIPVWGFAEVSESRHGEIAVGERIFGYLPMASELIVAPDAVGALAFQDESAHRAAGHPWYKRLYRCDADPLYAADREGVQAIMWALFMTGWALADDLAGTARSVVISSASSKTALSAAWALQQSHPDVQVVGLTSAGNVEFVAAAGVYDAITTYDDLDLAAVEGPAVYVDIAGSQGVKERVHAALGELLGESILIGGTHQGGEEGTGELSGPEPRFFFIPDVAEAADGGHAAFHDRFTAAWNGFVPWIETRLELTDDAGADAIVAAYERLLTGNPGPTQAGLFTW
ncbi:MAG: DUF2855 family protein [Pseudomonadota bacterium]